MVVRTLLDTTIESKIANARHAIGNRDGGQAAAIIESTISYARHAVGDGYRG